MGDLTAGYIYICNYLTGTTADSQTVAGKTEGVDYCKFKIH